MNDMRQKLLPVFLEEAGRKILQLEAFLAAGEEEGRSLVDLETAFRAAHTLKGTAALVQAEAVRFLSGRIEGLLESHFEQSRFPSEVEYEAMQLALNCLKQLIDAVDKKQEEPVGLLAEAELALKLSMAMPCRRRLAEVVVSGTPVDPFADDPEFDGPAGPCTADPFAEDPEIVQITRPSVDTPIEHSARKPALDDPFADDVDFDTVFAEEGPPSPAVSVVSFSDLNDPFVDDPALE